MNVEQIVKGLNEAAKAITKNNLDKGFFKDGYNVGELLMLTTSELGEAMEAHRKDKFAAEGAAKHLVLNVTTGYKELFQSTVKDTFDDEIADAIIRLLDLSGRMGIDIENHINAKLAYNKTRPMLHGKKY